MSNTAQDESEDDQRQWECPYCGATEERHHSATERPFCDECESRDGVLTEMEPAGPGSEKIVTDGGHDEMPLPPLKTDGGVDQSEAEIEQSPEWEIGIRAWGADDEPGEARYEHYHPRAETEDEAVEKAENEATGIGINSIVGMTDSYEVYMVEGPFDV